MEMDHAEGSSTMALLQKSIQSNKQHQQMLASYTERLETELSQIESLLELAEHEEDGEADAAIIDIPGSKRAASLIPSNLFLQPESPFYEDASRRSRYLRATVIHTMKQKELDALTEGVKEANHRRLAFEAKRNGKLFWDIESDDLLTNIEGLDWERIAEKVSDVSVTPRTAKECETKWLGDRHPKINRGTWSSEETAQLTELARSYGENRVNWKEVAQKLDTNRTPMDCMRHFVPKPHHYWDIDSDDNLRKAVKVYGKDNWNVVARHVSPNATAQQCQNRYLKSLDPNLRKGAWSDEEDNRLRSAVEIYGLSWVDIAVAIPGRTNEQCRDRWLSKLDPSLNKDAWTQEEDEELNAAFLEVGKKWPELTKRLTHGRTDLQVRKRVDYLLKQRAAEEKQMAAEKRQEKQRAREESQRMPVQQDNLGVGGITSQPLTNSEGVLILTPSFVVAEAIALVTRQHIGHTSTPAVQVEQATTPHTEQTSATHNESIATAQTEQAGTIRPRPKPRRIRTTRAGPADPPDETPHA
ncbi:hypothetical protein PC9H_005255 [Pleurotus ostreatus]|uniref:Uncharacterized protein n=1 Tax=Pleurotus ostreatus TaxID=5322 RepID=A0A8H6ZW57_PLEOS|nr:uncharacterized protein PC9H_005255 [Pleurotus ostreatus]KAF7433305.1 hypothetical protein PC9H_005255 [Pleurotus ostreatus]KAJ8698022.1 hypothetical protein PTI98_004783 [Pleurotus ostreatus]